MADGTFKPETSASFGVLEDVGKWRRGRAIRSKGIKEGSVILITKNGLSEWTVTSITEDNYLRIAFADGQPYQGSPIDPIRVVVIK